MKTREYTKHLREIADFLDAREEFEFEMGVVADYSKSAPITTLSFYDKEKFVAAAKIVGSADKSVGEGDYATFYLHSKNAPLKLSIQRDKVCRKTVKFECEPLFSSEEVAAL